MQPLACLQVANEDVQPVQSIGGYAVAGQKDAQDNGAGFVDDVGEESSKNNGAPVINKLRFDNDSESEPEPED